MVPTTFRRKKKNKKIGRKKKEKHHKKMFTLRVWLLRVSGLSTLSSRRANSCPFKTAKKKQFFKIKRFD
jgi:hypothetical protein